MRPMSEVVKGDRGVPVLTFYHLTPEQVDSLRELMMVNGHSPAHEARAEAGAHLDRWSPAEGVVSIHLHGERVGDFLLGLSARLGVHIEHQQHHWQTTAA